jgi:FtsH-binding integral membrane protein
LNAALVLVPVGAELVEQASAIAAGSGSREGFIELAARERTFGAVNLFLSIVTIFVAVLKPRLGQGRS